MEIEEIDKDYQETMEYFEEMERSNYNNTEGYIDQFEAERLRKKLGIKCFLRNVIDIYTRLTEAEQIFNDFISKYPNFDFDNDPDWPVFAGEITTSQMSQEEKSATLSKVWPMVFQYTNIQKWKKEVADRWEDRLSSVSAKDFYKTEIRRVKDENYDFLRPFIRNCKYDITKELSKHNPFTKDLLTSIKDVYMTATGITKEMYEGISTFMELNKKLCYLTEKMDEEEGRQIYELSAKRSKVVYEELRKGGVIGCSYTQWANSIIKSEALPIDVIQRKTAYEQILFTFRGMIWGTREGERKQYYALNDMTTKKTNNTDTSTRTQAIIEAINGEFGKLNQTK